MIHKLEDLTDGGKEELALALLLWKDFKGSENWANSVKQMFKFADMLGVTTQLEDLIKKMPCKFEIKLMI